MVCVAGAICQVRFTPFRSAHHVDGVLLISSHRGSPMVGHLRRAELPFVCCGKPLGRRGRVSYVAAEDREGARDERLVEVGDYSWATTWPSAGSTTHRPPPSPGRR